MREDRQKKRKRQRLITITICLLVIFALLWGAAALVRKLTNYANRTITSGDTEITAEQAQVQADGQAAEDRFAGVARNEYDADGFYKEGGFLHYEDAARRSEVGVDISAHQQNVDWAAVKAAGVVFAILRDGYRGYSAGTFQEDEQFRTNLQEAKAAGLKVGVYFFSQALDRAEAVEEAEFVLDLLGGEELDYPIFFDWEDIEDEARTDGMDSVTLTACAVAFCKRVELNGYRAGVYFNQRFGYEEFDLRELQDYELWLAEYALTPSFPYHFDVWQYANDGMLSGVDGPVDLNLAIVEIPTETGAAQTAE